jgi:NADH-quinone oxidoreductase subunit A
VYFDFLVVLVFLVAGVAFVGLSLVAGRFVRPKLPDPLKAMAYECGERPIGNAWFNFNPRFYLIALIFIVFDVEIALTFPVAVTVRRSVEAGQAWVAVVEIVIFLGVLLAALAYVWSKGDLDWVRDVARPEDDE